MIAALLLFVFSPYASAGWDNGNAGDTYVAEFKLTARDIAQRLELLTLNGMPVYDTKKLRAAIATLEVVSLPIVTLDGVEKDAVTYPSRALIEMNRARWNFLRRSTETRARMRMVVHEYLWWIDHAADKDFEVSDRLISFISPDNFSPNVWWNPVNPVNMITPGLVLGGSDCAFEPAKLNVNSTEEILDLQTRGEACGDNFRRLRVVKSTGLTPASSNVRGRFHKFELSVFDRAGVKVGEMGFEPEWGECLLPENGSCRVSGKLTIGGVDIVLWFLRE